MIDFCCQSVFKRDHNTLLDNNLCSLPFSVLLVVSAKTKMTVTVSQ